MRLFLEVRPEISTHSRFYDRSGRRVFWPAGSSTHAGCCRIHLLLVNVNVVVWERVPDVAVMVTVSVSGADFLAQAAIFTSAMQNSSAAVVLKR